MNYWIYHLVQIQTRNIRLNRKITVFSGTRFYRSDMGSNTCVYCNRIQNYLTTCNTFFNVLFHWLPHLRDHDQVLPWAGRTSLEHAGSIGLGGLVASHALPCPDHTDYWILINHIASPAKMSDCSDWSSAS